MTRSKKARNDDRLVHNGWGDVSSVFKGHGKTTEQSVDRAPVDQTARRLSMRHLALLLLQ